MLSHNIFLFIATYIYFSINCIIRHDYYLGIHRSSPAFFMPLNATYPRVRNRQGVWNRRGEGQFRKSQQTGGGGLE